MTVCVSSGSMVGITIFGRIYFSEQREGINKSKVEDGEIIDNDQLVYYIYSTFYVEHQSV